MTAAARLPAFVCEWVDDMRWRFWCPYCRKYHTHGAEPGHRVAHCGKDSPMKDAGYILLKPAKPR